MIDYSHSSERMGRRINDNRRKAKFNDSINYCKLIDLGCAGPKLTWCNGRKGQV